MSFLVNLVAALLAGQLQYVAAQSPAPLSGPQELCGGGLVKPVHIMPADKWVCPVADESLNQPIPDCPLRLASRLARRGWPPARVSLARLSARASAVLVPPMHWMVTWAQRVPKPTQVGGGAPSGKDLSQQNKIHDVLSRSRRLTPGRRSAGCSADAVSSPPFPLHPPTLVDLPEESNPHGEVAEGQKKYLGCDTAGDQYASGGPVGADSMARLPRFPHGCPATQGREPSECRPGQARGPTSRSTSAVNCPPIWEVLVCGR